ncbi:MAG: hypothetical protein U0Q16_29580 [Bryobacteraceae bacterium]
MALALFLLLLLVFALVHPEPQFTVVNARGPVWQVDFPGDWALPLLGGWQRQLPERLVVRQTEGRLLMRTSPADSAAISAECYDLRTPGQNSAPAIARRCGDEEWQTAQEIPVKVVEWVSWGDTGSEITYDHRVFRAAGPKNVLVRHTANNKWLWVFSLETSEIALPSFGFFAFGGSAPQFTYGRSTFQVFKVATGEEVVRVQSGSRDSYPSMAHPHWIGDRFLLTQFEPEFKRALIVELVD